MIAPPRGAGASRAEPPDLSASAPARHRNDASRTPGRVPGRGRPLPRSPGRVRAGGARRPWRDRSRSRQVLPGTRAAPGPLGSAGRVRRGDRVPAMCLGLGRPDGRTHRRPRTPDPPRWDPRSNAAWCQARRLGGPENRHATSTRRGRCPCRTPPRLGVPLTGHRPGHADALVPRIGGPRPGANGRPLAVATRRAARCGAGGDSLPAVSAPAMLMAA